MRGRFMRGGFMLGSLGVGSNGGTPPARPVAALVAMTLTAGLLAAAALPGDTQASSWHAAPAAAGPSGPSVDVSISGHGSGASAPYTFDGWGTSLAWWGETVGNWSSQQQDAVLRQLFGSPANSLGLTVVRYNIGASSAPGDRPGMTCPGNSAPHGYQGSSRQDVPKAVPVPQQGAGSPVDLSRDAAQLGIFKKINGIIGGGSHHYEAWADSPPWWMLTPSKDKNGNVQQCPIGTNSLSPQKYGQYAQFLTGVLTAFRSQEHISFDSIEPLNEPWAGFHWPNGCSEDCQEGKSFQPSEQRQIVAAVCHQLSQQKQLAGTIVSAPDGNTPNESADDFSALGDTANCLGRVNSHSYGKPYYHTSASTLPTHGHPVWMSEYGNGIGDKNNAVIGALTAARQIARDLQYMRARAWVYWQAVDQGDQGNQGGWGLLGDGSWPQPGKTTPAPSSRYYALAQYSRFIRPGATILRAFERGSNIPVGNTPSNTTNTLPNALTVAARDAGKIVLVTTNCTAADEPNECAKQDAENRSVRYHLGSLAPKGSTVRAWRTDASHKAQQIGTGGMSLANGTLTDPSQPAGSITTYVVQPPGQPGGDGAHVDYTGPVTASYHQAFTASARVTEGGSPASGRAVSFRLGQGGGTQECQATTGSDGSARCRLVPSQVPGPTTLTVTSGGASISVPFTVTRAPTAVAYTGPKHVANGVPAHLSARLTEQGGAPIGGRPVTIALGRGSSRQHCTATSDGSGAASCTIGVLNQPLTAAATVPVTVSFGGDAFYLPSQASASVRLEYYTGRAFGMSASVHPAVLTVRIPPSPDTGKVRVAKAITTTTPCTASVSAVLVTAGTLCPRVTTHLAPGTSTATATVSDVTVGLPGVPVIELSGVRATSTSTCGSAAGAVSLTVRVAGTRIAVSTAPGSGVRLPGGTRLIVNEQRPVPGADFGLTVTAARLILPGGLGKVTIASATSDAHNCS